MPLIKSKSDKAFKSNIKAEVAAGKPVKQAVAIAYSTKRAAKKATGGSMDPRDYDSDWDYKRATGQLKEEDDEAEDTGPVMSKAQKIKSENFVKKVTANRKMADVATAKGDKDEAKKQWDRLKRRGETVRLKSWTESELKKGPSKKAESYRKEWSEKIGKGKPAPFKSGGSTCW